MLPPAEKFAEAVKKVEGEIKAGKFDRPTQRRKHRCGVKGRCIEELMGLLGREDEKLSREFYSLRLSTIELLVRKLKNGGDAVGGG